MPRFTKVPKRIEVKVEESEKWGNAEHTLRVRGKISAALGQLNHKRLFLFDLLSFLF